jgi:hypothetical protein
LHGGSDRAVHSQSYADLVVNETTLGAIALRRGQFSYFLRGFWSFGKRGFFREKYQYDRKPSNRLLLFGE